MQLPLAVFKIHPAGARNLVDVWNAKLWGIGSCTIRRVVKNHTPGEHWNSKNMQNSKVYQSIQRDQKRIKIEVPDGCWMFIENVAEALKPSSTRLVQCCPVSLAHLHFLTFKQRASAMCPMLKAWNIMKLWSLKPTHCKFLKFTIACRLQAEGAKRCTVWRIQCWNCRILLVWVQQRACFLGWDWFLFGFFLP